MGYMSHHAILVTHWKLDDLSSLHNLAMSLFEEAVTPLTSAHINNYWPFAVMPDGSKEGWEESKAFDLKRNEFIERLQRSNVAWCEVQYGDESNDNRLLSASGGIM